MLRPLISSAIPGPDVLMVMSPSYMIILNSEAVLESRPDSNCRALETELLLVPLMF